jgi:hypothetical protein
MQFLNKKKNLIIKILRLEEGKLLMFNSGNLVRSKKTLRLGKVQSESKKYPGWFKVLWDGEKYSFRYEPEDLILVKCRYSDCTEGNPVAINDERVTCNKCRKELGLMEIGSHEKY